MSTLIPDNNPLPFKPLPLTVTEAWEGFRTRLSLQQQITQLAQQVADLAGWIDEETQVSHAQTGEIETLKEYLGLPTIASPRPLRGYTFSEMQGRLVRVVGNESGNKYQRPHWNGCAAVHSECGEVYQHQPAPNPLDRPKPEPEPEYPERDGKGDEQC